MDKPTCKSGRLGIMEPARADASNNGSAEAAQARPAQHNLLIRFARHDAVSGNKERCSCLRISALTAPRSNRIARPRSWRSGPAIANISHRLGLDRTRCAESRPPGRPGPPACSAGRRPLRRRPHRGCGGPMADARRTQNPAGRGEGRKAEIHRPQGEMAAIRRHAGGGAGAASRPRRRGRDLRRMALHRARLVRQHVPSLLQSGQPVLRQAGGARDSAGGGPHWRYRRTGGPLACRRPRSENGQRLLKPSAGLPPVCGGPGLARAARLADGIIALRFRPDESIPKGLDRDEVLRQLEATESDRPADIRDRAILMLRITCGLRAGAVAGLTLDDWDWHGQRLQARCPKPGRTSHYPLSPGVGNSIVRYFTEVRSPPGSERDLFLTMRAPVRPITAQAIGLIVRNRADLIGIVGKRRGRTRCATPRPRGFSIIAWR